MKVEEVTKQVWKLGEDIGIQSSNKEEEVNQ